MLNVFTLSLKLFANKPLKRLMYTIIISGLALWLIPKEFTAAFNIYTEIPWLFQTAVSVPSLVVAIFFSRLRIYIQKHYSSPPEQRVLLRLSEKKIAVLKDLLKAGDPIITSPCRSSVMKKLEREGIVQRQNDSTNCSYYFVTEKYSHSMELFWNSRGRRFNR